MNSKILLAVFCGAMVAAGAMFSGVGTWTRVEAQTPDPQPARTGETSDLHLLKIQHEFALKQLNRAQEELMKDEDRIRQKEVDLSIRKNKLKQLADVPITVDEVEAIIGKDRAFKRLRKEIEETEQVLKQTAVVIKDGMNSAVYKRLKKALDDLGDELAKRREELRPDAVEEIHQARQAQLNAEIAALEDTILVLKTQEKSLQATLDLLIEKTRQLGGQEKETTPANLKLLNLEQKLDKILDRLEKIEKRLDKLELRK
jgi:hypothetical protein